MWLPSRGTSHSPSAPYASLIVLRQAILRKKLLPLGYFPKLALTLPPLCFEQLWGYLSHVKG